MPPYPETNNPQAELERMMVVARGGIICPPCGGSGREDRRFALAPECPTCKGARIVHDIPFPPPRRPDEAEAEHGRRLFDYIRSERSCPDCSPGDIVSTIKAAEFGAEPTDCGGSPTPGCGSYCCGRHHHHLVRENELPPDAIHGVMFRLETDPLIGPLEWPGRMWNSVYPCPHRLTPPKGA